ncbi:sodium:solute symporter family transporter [Arhodomonas aquaeolei]|uniref:sodium:solute symporter family transporter n=1 Tax=Arhodomonas aquaeolei TaxID=2369 RepID=UPI00037BA4F4|nr:hypothetical protein [Arhodomonas aquaeolei]
MPSHLLPLAFWGFLLIYGGTLYVISPRAPTAATFYDGVSAGGRGVSAIPLTLSVFISWIFAKSVTNAANLGATYGAVGALAYATYWLSIPVAGIVIYRLRTRLGASSMTEFLVGRYGRGAAIAFSAAILVRLYNEVWSNTAVVGGYFGAPGTTGYITASVAFTAITLAYSIKGGLRGSIVTDGVQAVVFVALVVLLSASVLPAHGVGTLLASGDWRLDAGLDLLLVAGLQVFSYPFHDPVLTDRGFLARERTMLRAFLVAGILGFVAIAGFGLIGAHAMLSGIDVMGNAPAAVARSMGLGAFFLMSVVMMSSAGSTLDSTFSSLARSVARDMPRLAGNLHADRLRTGAIAMTVFAVLGNLPMLAGTDILRATTISGTMVIGLAPVFIFHGARRAALNFHLSFWTGIGIGIVQAFGAVPDGLHIGDGPYAALLGANAWGLALCTALFWLPLPRARGTA